MESRWECILASIFNGFWWIFGGKLGGKIEPRQDKTGQDRARQDKTRQDKDKDKTRQDFGRQKCRGDLLRPGGGGFAPLLGGYYCFEMPSLYLFSGGVGNCVVKIDPKIHASCNRVFGRKLMISG